MREQDSPTEVAYSDVIADIQNWTPTDEYYDRTDQNRMWFQFWRPREITFRIYQRSVQGILLRVGICFHNSLITIESID